MYADSIKKVIIFMNTIKQYALPAIIFILICLIFALIMNQNINWDTWRIATCMPDNCFCEQIRYDETIRQPSNTWSAMVFTLIGVLVAGHALNQLEEQHRLSLSFAIIFSIALIVIGVGSAFYHASMTFWGQFFDVGGMYLLVSFMLVYAWIRLYGLSTVTDAILYIGINIILFAMLYFVPETRRGLFALALFAGISFELYYAAFRKPELKRYWFNYGLLLFAIAYAIWNLDTNRILCDADSLLQGHAIWHIFGAVSSGMLYLYYVSETQES